MSRTLPSFGVASAGRILIAVLLVWLLLIFFIGGSIFRRTDPDYIGGIGGENGEMILARLSRANSELNALKSQNEELRKMLENLVPFKKLAKDIGQATRFLESGPGHPADGSPLATEPDQQYEQTRRRLQKNTDELWHFLRKQLNGSQYEFVRQHRHNMLYDYDLLSNRDSQWRRAQFDELEQYMSDVLNKLQNPDDCSAAQKVVCRLNKGCGFGCQIHHVVYCFVVGLATGRTVILDASGWRYVDSKHKKSNAGWNLVFKPVSETCLDDSGTRSSWKGGSESAQVLDLPIIDSMRPRPPYLPLTIPEQLSEKLQTLHGDPIVWFLGQITRYIMRLSPEMEQFVNEAKDRIQFKRPIVGIHVRRTDKVGSEAAFHPLSEYMNFVEDFYHGQNIRNQRRRQEEKINKNIYLATDDPGLWTKEVPIFEDKGFTFLGDADIAQTAGIGTRYTIDSLRNIILDIILLSECDHLVCTFSSQVCRMAYELMQTRKDLAEKHDWSGAYYSLDDIYYYGGQSSHNQVAILSHNPVGKDDMKLQIGDIIGIAGNHWNGYSKGFNRQSSQHGLYPGFKTVEKVDAVKFKAFDLVERKKAQN